MNKRSLALGSILSLSTIALPLVPSACTTRASEAVSSAGAPIVLGTPATDHPEAVLVDLYQGGTLTAYCSGTVIAPYVVLTAGHCVDGIGAWQITAPLSGQTAQSSVGVMLDWAGNGETLDAQAHDVGLVILSSPIALASYPVLATSEAPDGSDVVDVGRVQDGTLSTTSLFDSMPLRLYDGSAYGWPLDYVTMDAVQPGDSGGPGYWAGPSASVLVAVSSGATKDGHYEILTRVDLVASWITTQLAAYPAGAPYAPPPVAVDAGGGSDALPQAVDAADRADSLGTAD